MAVEGRWVVPVEHRTLAAARASGGPLDVAVRRAVASLEERDAAGAFLFAAVSVILRARRPAAADGTDR